MVESYDDIPAGVQFAKAFLDHEAALALAKQMHGLPPKAEDEALGAAVIADLQRDLAEQALALGAHPDAIDETKLGELPKLIQARRELLPKEVQVARDLHAWRQAQEERRALDQAKQGLSARDQALFEQAADRGVRVGALSGATTEQVRALIVHEQRSKSS